MKRTMYTRTFTRLAAAAVAMAAPAALAEQVTVTIRNLAPTDGTFLTPMWVGFHNGGFDSLNLGAAASPGLESLAEDGATATISAEFTASGAGAVQGTIASGGIPPIEPGETTSMVFDLDPLAASSRYFSYASMVIPSNDAFLANDDPFEHMIFDAAGNFQSQRFFLLGSEVLDAGSEVNDELPANTAFFGQAAPNTGVTEGGTVGAHPGFFGSFGNPGGIASILASADFANADFTLPGYTIAEVTVTPEPGALALLAIGGLAFFRRR